MKLLTTIMFILALSSASTSFAQPQQPFIAKLYGGLFFPSIEHFEDVYHSGSEAIWGVGVSLPMGSFVFLDGDFGFFRASALIDPVIDSSVYYEENIIHVGLLHKQQIGRLIFFRALAGLNYATVKQRYTSPRFPGQTIEADKKIGYFGGAGIERMVESGQASFFADLIYDYRRSHVKEFEGDLGGVRLVIGIHVFLF
mgnify:CR=1 FL=1